MVVFDTYIDRAACGIDGWYNRVEHIDWYSNSNSSTIRREGSSSSTISSISSISSGSNISSTSSSSSSSSSSTVAVILVSL